MGLKLERKVKYTFFNILSKIIPSRKISKIKLHEIKNILVLGQDRFGDTILSTPALEALRKFFPNSRIIFLSYFPYYRILLNNPNYDEIIVFNKKELKNLTNAIKFIKSIRKYNFDLAISFCTYPIKLTNALLGLISKAKYRIAYEYTHKITNEINEIGMNKFFFNILVPPPSEEIHVIEWNLRLVEYIGFNCNEIDKKPKIFLTNEEKNYAKEFLKLLKQKTIGIHPVLPKGNYFGLNEYKKLVSYILKFDVDIVLIESNQSKENVEKIIKLFSNIKVLRETDIRKIAAIISNLSLVISNDTSLVHIASSFNVPTITFFAEDSNPRRWRPWGENNYVFTKNDKNLLENVIKVINIILQK